MDMYEMYEKGKGESTMYEMFEDEENELENYSTKELQDELLSRKEEPITEENTEPNLPVVGVVTLFAEFSCPDCGYYDQVDLALFDDDDNTFEIYCERCNFNFVVDLEEEDI
jgi:hypothetical protein